MALPVHAQTPFGLELGSSNPLKELRDSTETNKPGGMIGVTVRVHRFEPDSWFGDGFAVRVRADVGAYPKRTAPAREVRSMQASLDLVHAFGPGLTGFQLVAGVGGSRWRERLDPGTRNATRFADTLGIGWQWKRFGVELRYTGSSLDARRSADSLDLVWTARF